MNIGTPGRIVYFRLGGVGTAIENIFPNGAYKEEYVLLNDAVTIPGVDTKQVPIIKGDAKSISIAAASIVAKVTRDRMMVDYSREFPGYDLESNKGYGTKAHIAGLKEFGASSIHRRTFIKKFVEQEG